MATLLSGYAISPVPRETNHNLLKVVPGFKAVFNTPSLSPCALALKYISGSSKDRKQGTSYLENTLGRANDYVTGSPVFELSNYRHDDNEFAPTPRRNTLDPAQFVRKAVRRNSCMPSISGLEKVREKVRKSCGKSPTCTTPKNSLILDRLSISSKVLGTGGFGAVYLGVLNSSKVAVKKLHTQTKNVKAKAESFRAELHAKSLVHPNIVRILATSPTEDCHMGFIVMEYVGDRNLQQILGDCSNILSPYQRISYALDIAQALDFIHTSCLVHLDVKPANILVTNSGLCKLGDFGCCQIVENGTGRVSPTQRSYLTGTFAYRAPELLRGEAPCTKADIYSMGITLWQMVSRRQPYHGQNQHVVIFGVVAYNLRPDSAAAEYDDDDTDEDDFGKDSVDGFIDFYQELYSKCWSSIPDDRPSAEDLVNALPAWKNELKMCNHNHFYAPSRSS